MPSLQVKRGTRTQIDAAASGSGLKEGELYLVTDEGKLLVGTSLTTYSEVAVNTDLAAKAPLASPALTGTPTAPTAPAGTNTTQIATTAFVLANAGSVESLPNNTRINSVEHFYQTTKPTARGDASALVAGDRWWKTDDGTEWFWNGTYWLSTNVRILDLGLENNAGPGSVKPGTINIYNEFLGNFIGTQPYFFTYCEISGWSGYYPNDGINTHDASNHVAYTFSYLRNTDVTSIVSLDTIGVTLGIFKKVIPINFALLAEYHLFRIEVSIVGAANNNSRFSPKFFARIIYVD